jgi:hypothetical protein
VKLLLLSIALASLPMSAFADFSCSAVPRAGVDPVTCAMWTALLLSAKKDNRAVSFYYSGSIGCAALPVYANSPAPYYIG